MTENYPVLWRDVCSEVFGNSVKKTQKYPGLYNSMDSVFLYVWPTGK